MKRNLSRSGNERQMSGVRVDLLRCSHWLFDVDPRSMVAVAIAVIMELHKPRQTLLPK